VIENSGNTGKTDVEQTTKPMPLMIKAIALLLTVYGVIGLSYYLSATIYSIMNLHFLENLEFKSFKGDALFIPLTVEVLVHISIVLSGFLIFYKKKSGLWFYCFSLFFSLLFFIIFTSYINYAEIIIGSLLLIVLLGYRSRFS
jgi:phosphatidylserine synthase